MSDQQQPNIAQKAPFGIEVQSGKTYWWCACGLSKKQPFCDGSHKGGAFSPVSWTAGKDGKAWFCGCKRSGNAPLCDGTHKSV
jgi:CDGSH-type Zn-finger protein